MAGTCRLWKKRVTIPFLAATPTLALVGLLAWTVVTIAQPKPSRQAVYTVAEVYDHLLRRPAAWLGKTVLVRGWYGVACASWSGPDPYTPCVTWATGLVDPNSSALVLPLTTVDPPAVTVFLRGLPLLGLLAPPPPRPVPGRVAIYRVRLQIVLCGPPTQCIYQGVLLDIAPGAG